MRTLHFVIAWAIVLFVLVHVFEVIVSGLWNNLRSMITGRYEVRTKARGMTGRSARRSFLGGVLGAVSAALLTGCDGLSTLAVVPETPGGRVSTCPAPLRA